MTTAEILLEAATIIDRGWCRGEMARDQYGQKVHTTKSTACQWCALGALALASDTNWPAFELAAELVRSRVGEKLSEWNDAPGQTGVNVAEEFRAAAMEASA